MTSIAKLVAALIAVLTVAVGGHALAAPLTSHRSVAARTLTTVSLSPLGTDADTLHLGRPTRVPPPTPPAPAAPAAAPAAPAASAYGAPVHVALAPRPAPPPPVVVGSAQQAYINSDRASAGLGPLTWSSCLAGIAYQNALRMANQGFISHAGGSSQDLGCGLGSQAGENVGYWSAGINDAQLNTMFMNSPDHRANIMGPYHYVATSWVVARNGYAYIAVEFS